MAPCRMIRVTNIPRIVTTPSLGSSGQSAVWTLLGLFNSVCLCVLWHTGGRQTGHCGRGLEREAEVSALFFSLSPGKFPKTTRTPRLCFTPFCFNALCQLTKLLNLGALIFCLTPFRWFLMHLNLFNGNMIFIYALLKLRPLFQGRK